MRDWGRARHNDHSLWWSVLARNKRRSRSNLRDGEGQAIARELIAGCGRRARELPARHDGALGPRPEDVHAPQSGRDLRAGHRLRPDRPLSRAAGIRGRAARRSAACATSTATPDQAPPRTGISLGDSLAALSAFQGILLALYARDARGGAGQVVDASIADACFAMTESTVARVREDRGHPRADRYAHAEDRAVERLSQQRRPLGRDRREPRHALAAARPAHGRPEFADDPRFANHTPRARTRTCSTR